MKLSLQKFDDAIRSLQQAKDNAKSGNLRMIKADLDFAKEKFEAAYWLAKAEEDNE